MIEALMIACGVIGTVLVVSVYFMLQHDRVSPKSVWFSAINGVGAFMIFISIGYDFDPADTGGLLVEGAWLLVSIYGVMRALKRPAALKI